MSLVHAWHLRWSAFGARIAFMSSYDLQHISVAHHLHGVVVLTINRPEKLNACNSVLHRELSDVWPMVDADPEAAVAVVTGAGRAFSAGGDVELLDAMSSDYGTLMDQMRDDRLIVQRMLEMEKPVISAINGVAVGAGAAVALMADISIMAESARITDGHVRIGVAAGDHAVLLWPLMVGMAKAKRFLLTGDFVDGAEAERMGLVSQCLPDDEVLPAAMELAARIARGPQDAVRLTKRALNHWWRQAWPTFEHSVALEMLGFMGPDAREGIAAVREKRRPQFGSGF